MTAQGLADGLDRGMGLLDRAFRVVPGWLAVTISATWIVVALVLFVPHFDDTPFPLRWWAPVAVGLQSALWALCCVAAKEE